jgi:pimeloyl-ACP methyl ester carboxylesterase
VYPQLQGLDFMIQALRLEVPVYFLVGRHDVIEMALLTERYYHVLQAPHKELLWFDKSEHTLLAFDPNKVVDVLVNHVLAQTSHEMGLAETRKGA